MRLFGVETKSHEGHDDAIGQGVVEFSRSTLGGKVGGYFERHAEADGGGGGPHGGPLELAEHDSIIIWNAIGLRWVDCDG